MLDEHSMNEGSRKFEMLCQSSTAPTAQPFQRFTANGCHDLLPNFLVVGNWFSLTRCIVETIKPKLYKSFSEALYTITVKANFLGNAHISLTVSCTKNCLASFGDSLRQTFLSQQRLKF